MPAAFSRDQIAALAQLARLELDEAEAESFGRQIGEILEYATQVQQIDTTGVPPTASVLTRLVNESGDREDETTPSMDRLDALANAPDAARDAGLFKVPRVIG